MDNAVSEVLNGVDARVTSFRRLGEPIYAERLPSASLREATELRLGTVNGALMPLQRSEAEQQRAARAVAAMLSGWMTAKAADPAAKASAYVALLADLPGWVVEQVCKDVARGHVESMDPDFPPSAARLHQLGEAFVAELKRERDRLQTVMDVELRPKPSDDERERVGKAMREASSQLETGLTGGDGTRRQHVVARTIEDNDREIERGWEQVGQDPPRLSNGRPVSRELVEILSPAKPQAAE